MKNIKRITASLLSACVAAAAVPTMGVYAQTQPMSIVIDGDKANIAENCLYRGAGMVTGNNTSRLLLDYKVENPDAYWEIMEHLFSENGLAISHIKIEMGSDINSSSGTEPAVMRTADENADVTRGAGYQLAADAMTINPDLTLDMLWWSEPLWVTNAEDVYAARYKWYKETLDAAYETYGLEFDYVSATQNERSADNEWIKYLSNSLKAETDCPYDYSKIKIVAGDEVCSWWAAEAMLSDPELMEAVDVLGSHYTSWSTEAAQKLVTDYGKELWFSEASTSMVYSQGTHKYDATGSGLNDLNGVLDIANRYITMYPGGMMTMCEYQPVVSACYDGVNYCHKQFIAASDPWSGYYYLDNGYYMQLHFSQFMKKGWAFIDGACYGDGVAGGDGHAIVDAVYSYVTATDTATDDYTTVITNTTAEDITYNFTVTNLDKAGDAVYVWETRGPDSAEDEFNENYFKNIDVITPTDNGDGTYGYSVTLKPDSLVTLSTVELDYNEADHTNVSTSEKTVLALPYEDDFEYDGYSADYLSSRGNAPRYMTDQGGAFEVQTGADGNNYLQQIITPETKANEWGGTPNPTTNFGDDRWSNYSVSADVKLTESTDASGNYAGIGLRFNLAAVGDSGYRIQVYESGRWQLLKCGSELLSGNITDLDTSAWINLKIEANQNNIKGYVNGELVADYTAETDSLLNSGRAALFSSYNQNCFDNISINAIDGAETFITRYDNTDDNFTSYEGTWRFETISGFKSYKRTLFRGGDGAKMTFDFNGTDVAVTGNTTKDCIINVTLDGEPYATELTLPKSTFRESAYQIRGLENGKHTVTVEVISGTLSVDAIEVTGDVVPYPTEKPAEDNSTPTEITDTAAEEVTDSTTTETSSEASDDAADNGGFPVVPVAAGGAVVVAVAAVGIVIAKKKKQ